MPCFRDDAAIHIRNRHATLHATRLDPAASVTLPDAPWVHLYVADGAVDVAGVGRLDHGDAVRLTGFGGQRIHALQLSELLAWEMHARLDA